MKKFLRLILIVIAIFSMAGIPKKSAPNKRSTKGIGRWSGTVTREIITTVSNGVYTGKTEIHGKATFINALPTMYRNDGTTDLDFTDDKGIGSHGVHSEMTDLTGKKCVADCAGNSQAELHSVVIRESDNTYDIEVIFPKCIGTGDCKADGIYEADDLEAIVSSHSLGSNKDVLAGAETTTSELPGGGTVTSTTTWNLTRSKSQIELIVTPQDYDSWMPEPGKNELTAGKIMNIDLKVIGATGLTSKSKVKSFELHLSNTSSEPGLTLNAPLHPTPDMYDIGFMKPGAPPIGGEAQEITVPCPGCTTASVKLGSFDGGGCTTLTATAILEDGSEIEGHLITSGGVTEIPIPKRSPNSKIATAWLQANGDPGEMDDNEESADNSNNGDGLSAYEEYRGVISEGKFKRLDPKEKELGVYETRADFTLFSEGLGWFENASGLKIIRFFENEIGPDRRINNNGSYAQIYKQYVIKLKKGSINEHKDAVGKTYPHPGIPKDINVIKIDYNKIVVNQAQTETRAKGLNLQLPWTLEEMIAKTVAHELAHGVNVRHHGESDIMELQNTKLETVDPHIRVFSAPPNREIFDRPITLSGAVGLIESGNQESGDIFCIMNYNPFYSWSGKDLGNDNYVFYRVPLIPLGNLFCKSKDGTDINTLDGNMHNNYFGNATVGNCLSQIQLK